MIFGLLFGASNAHEPFPSTLSYSELWWQQEAWCPNSPVYPSFTFTGLSFFPRSRTWALSTKAKDVFVSGTPTTPNLRSTKTWRRAHDKATSLEICQRRFWNSSVAPGLLMINSRSTRYSPNTQTCCQRGSNLPFHLLSHPSPTEQLHGEGIQEIPVDQPDEYANTLCLGNSLSTPPPPQCILQQCNRPYTCSSLGFIHITFLARKAFSVYLPLMEISSSMQGPVWISPSPKASSSFI